MYEEISMILEPIQCNMEMPQLPNTLGTIGCLAMGTCCFGVQYRLIYLLNLPLHYIAGTDTG